MAAVVQLLNQKGGVGKTSTCFHLSGTLARMGHRVLLLDGDPQASLTQGFWGPQAVRDVEAGASMAALFDPKAGAIPSAIIRPTGVPGVDIVPGSRHLTTYNMHPPEWWADSQMGVREFVDEVRDDYSIMLLDSPPNLQLCSWAGLVAADFLLVPLGAEDFASQGLAPVFEAMAAVQAGPNPGIRLAGLILTAFDKRLGVHLAYSAMLREIHGAAVFEAVFPRAKDFVEAVAARAPIGAWKPKSAGAKATQVVTDELLGRIGLAAGRAAHAGEGRAA